MDPPTDLSPRAWPPGVSRHLELTDGTLTAARAGELGVNPHQLRSLTLDGRLTRVGRGVYIESSRLRTRYPEEAHLVRARALARARPDLALSHHSGAIVQGLPWLDDVPDRVHFTRTGPGQHRRGQHVTIHTAYSEAGVRDAEGARTLDIPHLMLGVAEQHSIEQVLVVGDAALHRQLTTLDELEKLTRSYRRRPGVSRLTAALPQFDPQTESPGETLTRWAARALGYEVESQVRFRLPNGEYARVDFRLRRHRVLVEFDGKVKYQRADDSGDVRVLMAEKAREEQLCALDYVVVRLVMWEVRKPDVLRRKLDQAVQRARQRWGEAG